MTGRKNSQRLGFQTVIEGSLGLGDLILRTGHMAGKIQLVFESVSRSGLLRQIRERH